MEIKLILEKPIAFYPQLSRALGGVEEAIYFQQLYYWADKGGREDGYIYKTKVEIEEETTLTRRQQDRIRVKFKKMGILEEKLIKAKGAPTLHYKLNIGIVQNVLMEWYERYYSNSTKGTNPLTENTTENTTKRREGAETAPTPTNVYSKEFTELWNTYPIKQGKLVAYKAWKKVKEPTSKLIEAVNKQKTWDQWEKGYIPHLATWLNQGRWEDEEPPKPKQPDKKNEKKPYYRGDKVVEKNGKLYVISNGEWLEFADDLKEIEYK